MRFRLMGLFTLILSYSVSVQAQVRFYDATPKPYHTGNPGKQTFYEFTNFYQQAPIQLKVPVSTPASYRDIACTRSEGLFQAIKFFNTPHERTVLASFNGGSAKAAYDALAPLTGFIIPTWHQVKLYIMYKVVKAKIEQSTHLQAILRSTRSLELIEHIQPPRIDPEWGNSLNPTDRSPGKNWLGKILMLIRNELFGFPFPPHLESQATETMAQFRAVLAQHKTAWLRVYGAEILTPRELRLLTASGDDSDDSDARPAKTARSDVAGAAATAPRISFRYAGYSSKDYTPVFTDGTVTFAWASHNPTGTPCFKRYDATSGWGSYYPPANGPVMPYQNTGRKSKDGTVIWQDSNGNTFAWTPRDKCYRLWNSTLRNQLDNSCWGNRY